MDVDYESMSVEGLEQALYDLQQQKEDIRAQQREIHAVLDEKNAAFLAEREANKTDEERALDQGIG